MSHNIVNHYLHASYLIKLHGDVEGRFPGFIEEKEREFLAEELVIFGVEQVFNRPLVEGKIWNHALYAKFKEILEEHLRVRLLLDICLDVSLVTDCKDALKKKQLSQSDFPHLYFIDIVELCLLIQAIKRSLSELLLNSDLTIVVELARKLQVVGRLYPQVGHGA